MIDRLIALFSKWRYKNAVLKTDVIRCFDGVDWTNQTFTVDQGVMMSTSDGCTHFYKVHSIDLAIHDLNMLLKQ